MEIRLDITGGMGIRLSGTLPQEAISESLSRAVEQAVDDGTFARCETTPENPQMADVQHYEISVRLDRPGAHAETFSFDDSQAPGPVLDLIDQMTAALRTWLLKSRG